MNIEIKSRWRHKFNKKAVIVDNVDGSGMVTASFVDKASQIYGASFMMDGIKFQNMFSVIDSVKPMETNTSKQDQFVEAFNALANEAHSTGVQKGWWDKERNNGELIALCHSELSEALEALRHGNPPDDKVPEYTGVEAELADCIIRIMDMAAARNWHVAEALVAKMAMNKTRPKMHGGKVF